MQFRPRLFHKADQAHAFDRGKRREGIDRDVARQIYLGVSMPADTDAKAAANWRRPFRYA